MKRCNSLSLRALVVTVVLGISFGASALPLSPKWMKSNAAPKVNEPGKSGELGDGLGNGGGGGGVQALPLPGSGWLVLVGVAGIAAQRRKSSSV